MNKKRRMSISDEDAYFNDLCREQQQDHVLDDTKRLFGVVHVGWLLLGQAVAMVLVMVYLVDAQESLAYTSGRRWFFGVVACTFWAAAQLSIVGMFFYINELAGKLLDARTRAKSLQDTMDSMKNQP